MRRITSARGIGLSDLPNILLVTIGNSECSVVWLHAEVVQKTRTKVVFRAVRLLKRKLDNGLRANPTQLYGDDRSIGNLEGQD